MKRIWDCRRTFIAFMSILGLLSLAFYLEEPSIAISVAGIAVGLAGSNAWEGRSKNEFEEE